MPFLLCASRSVLTPNDPTEERWRGFQKTIVGADDLEYSKVHTPKTHGHGAAFADFDRNWHTDLLLNPGGFALTDTLLAKSWDGYK